jgi:hypothetical protein
MVEDGEDLQAMAATFVRVRREVDPVAIVSQVKNGYFYLS